ncbi:hypothetical protein JOE50_006228 [Bradyrhizobium japonicum]|nr:hypothetical protein [Bradyrhizobium japonicum]
MDGCCIGWAVRGRDPRHVLRCHHPRKQVIQYSEALVGYREAAAYWIPRLRGV